jgi:hypothetical protein
MIRGQVLLGYSFVVGARDGYKNQLVWGAVDVTSYATDFFG